jgi:adenine deaminase
MEIFVRYFGLSNLQAIQCGTQAGAIGLKMQGKTGAISVGLQADLICVDGDPSKDVTILGEPGRIKHVMVGGRPMDLSELPERNNIPGWRLASMGSLLTRDVAFSNRAHVGPPLRIEELH